MALAEAQSEGDAAAADPTGGEEAADGTECAICFEAIGAQLGTKLPCRCVVGYCCRCWDRALAQSFNVAGKARCPSCREPVRVDFDPERCCLVFSVERQDATDAVEVQPGWSSEQRQALETAAIRERLIEQARPAQIRLLQQLSVALEKDTEADARPDKAQFKPPCVCGGLLERVSGEERARRYIRMRAPHCDPESERFQSMLRLILQTWKSTSYCDLCGRTLAVNTDVWTCEAGDKTVLHANAFDVCEACFQHYTGGGDEASLPAPPEDDDSEQHAEEIADIPDNNSEGSFAYSDTSRAATV
eukprot:TRINITY_DN21241_c1_g1_i1.p1 TRINITY_DN21241_c1_g1~~TRINITY_DN21241_c1_g1_i1.p1  ORF type:complete len:303 (+),score=63.65 TRINITY_DN21241_c1_g1_i1:122-1030(+)